MHYENGNRRAQWTRPEVKKLAAGAAESNGATRNDGGPFANPRS